MDDSGFKNKRKNVIGFSILLWYLFLSGYPIGTLPLLGLELPLVHSYVMIILWILFYYFLYRLILHSIGIIIGNARKEYSDYIWGGFGKYGYKVIESQIEKFQSVDKSIKYTLKQKVSVIIVDLDNYFKNKDQRFISPFGYQVRVNRMEGNRILDVHFVDKKESHQFKMNLRIRFIQIGRNISYFITQRDSSEYLIPAVFGIGTSILGIFVGFRKIYHMIM